MRDLESLQTNDDFTVELLNADDSPLLDEAGKPQSITVYGPGSKEYAKAQAARTQRLMDRMATKGRKKMSAEEQQRDNAEFLAACTKSFNGVTYRGSATDFLGLYLNSRLGFIGDQVAKAIGDWANFSTSSAMN